MKSPIPSLKCAGRNAFVTLGTVFGLTIGGVAVHDAAGQSPVTDGMWSTLSYTMPINPIHCSVMHTGKVLVVAGSENDPDEQEYRVGRSDPGRGFSARCALCANLHIAKMAAAKFSGTRAERCQSTKLAWRNGCGPIVASANPMVI